MAGAESDDDCGRETAHRGRVGGVRDVGGGTVWKPVPPDEGLKQNDESRPECIGSGRPVPECITLCFVKHPFQDVMYAEWPKCTIVSSWPFTLL